MNVKSHKNYLEYFWNCNLHAPLAKHVTSHNIFKIHSASQLSKEFNYCWTSPNVYAAANNGGSVLVTCQMMRNWLSGFRSSGMWHCVTVSWYFEEMYCLHCQGLKRSNNFPWNPQPFKKAVHSFLRLDHTNPTTQFHMPEDLNLQ
jgi:hypothetical protein